MTPTPGPPRHRPPAHPPARPAAHAADPASARSWPEDLEAWLVARARARAPRSTEAEALDRLVPAAAALSDLFTTARPAEFPDYHADPDASLAYALVFAPQTWARTRLALAEAVEARGWRPPQGRPTRVLDVGAGPGAAGWAAAHWLVARGHAPGALVDAVDRSAAARGLLAAVAAAGLPCARGVDLRPRGLDLAATGAAEALASPADLVVWSFALNEVAAGADDASAVAWLEASAAALDPRGLLLVVEPALRSTAERLRRVAGALAATGRWHVTAPDLGDRVAPPPSDPRFFDHEVRAWRMPPSLARVNLRLRRSLNELTFAFLALSPAPPAPTADDGRRTRVTSPVARMKGRLAWTGLDADGARSTYDLLERNLSRDDRARVLAFERGDHLVVRDPSPLREAGWWRIPGPHAVRTAWHPD